MDDFIGRKATIDAVETIGFDFSDSDLSAVELEEVCEAIGEVRQEWLQRIKRLPSAQPERLTDDDFETIRIHLNAYKEKLCNQHRWEEADEYQRIIDRFMSFASAQPDSKELSFTQKKLDTISRQAAIDAVDESLTRVFVEHRDIAEKMINKIPSAQPERTCVNCGRTVNNGGWYADGGTRCPIEEHYALPKDGYCHLWEERNVTDDDYPERRTDE